MDTSVILFSLFGPFLVWPFEYFLPYPYVVEELFKLVLVLTGVKSNAKTFMLAGIAFALTETVFYSTGINSQGSVILMFTRLILTSALHSFTFLLIYWFAKKDKGLAIFGFTLAVLTHYLYNKYIGTMVGV